MAKQEMVLAVKQQQSFSQVHGIIELHEPETLRELIPCDDLVLGARSWLEHDNRYLQIIPYIKVTNANGELLAYYRTNAGTETRLHDKVSIGFGGHVNIVDLMSIDSVIDVQETILECAVRELEEELSLEVDSLIIEGLIWDYGDEVGEVHLGVSCHVVITNEQISTLFAETSCDLIGFKTIGELNSGAYRLEKWSKLAINLQ